MKFHYIYITENLINGKIYIGKHSSKFMNDSYLGSGKLLKKAVKKYGKENFQKQILLFCPNSDEAFKIERQIVNEIFVKSKNTYNTHLGGDGFNDDVEFRKLSSKRMSEMLQSGKIIRCNWTGRKHSEASKTLIGTANSKHQKGEKNSQFGKIWILNFLLKKSKLIQKEEFEFWCEQGWEKGRKLKW